MNPCLVRLLFLIAMLAACAGCTFFRHAEILTIKVQDSEVVHGTGYAARSQHQKATTFEDFRIDLRSAPPFIFTFPDGYRADSKAIDARLLIDHGIPITREGNLIMGSWSRGDFWSLLIGRHYGFIFFMREDGSAETLSISSCGYREHDVLGTSDAARFFDFPLTKNEAEQLFRASVDVERVFAIWGFSCI